MTTSASMLRTRMRSLKTASVALPPAFLISQASVSVAPASMPPTSAGSTRRFPGSRSGPVTRSSSALLLVSALPSGIGFGELPAGIGDDAQQKAPGRGGAAGPGELRAPRTAGAGSERAIAGQVDGGEQGLGLGIAQFQAFAPRLLGGLIALRCSSASAQ
jgi:hypothetical protein